MRIISRVGIGKDPGTTHHLDVTGSSNFDGQVYFQNTANFNANVELGNATSDLISFNGRIDTNVEPNATLTLNFGSSTLFWNNTYSKNLYIKNAGSIESDGNTLNLGSVSATTINIGTTAATTISIGATTGTTTINNASVVLLGDLQVRGGDLTTNQTTFNLLTTTATTVNFASAATTLSVGAATGIATINNASVVLLGDLEVRGGDLTTNQTTFNLLNATATTLNIGSAATTINLGASSGTVTIKNASVVLDGDLQVKGGDLTTNQPTFNLFNATATTVNFAGAATTLSVGATTGTTTINNASTVLLGDLEVRGGDLTTNQTTFNLLNTTATTVNFAGAAAAISIGATTGTTTINNANVVLLGDLQVRGGDLTTNQTTFNLLNTTATTVNFANTATTISIGSASGTTTINQNLVVSGNLTVNGTTTTVNTTVLDVKDNNIRLNKSGTDATAAGAGISVEGTGSSTLANLLYDATLASKFKLGSNGLETEIVTTGTTQTITGAKTFSSDVVLSSDLAVNGGDLTTNQTTFNLLNTTATTVNFAGAASTVNLGGSSSNIAVAGKATVQSLVLGYRAISAATTILASDQVIYATGTSSYTVTLPSVTGISGKQYTIKCDLNADYYLTINTTSGQLIDSSTTKVLATGESITVISNGTKWINVNAPLNEGRGIVPLGAIIPIGSTSAWAVPGATAIKDGFALCNGQPFPTGSNAAFSGNRPNLTDSRFLQGFSSAGSSASTNTRTLTVANLPAHNHANTLSNATVASSGHTHDMKHVHQWSWRRQSPHWNFYGLNYASVTQDVFSSGTALNYISYGSGNGYGEELWINSRLDEGGRYFTSRSINSDQTSKDSTGGPSNSTTVSINNVNTGSGTAFDIRPQYFNVIYIMRVV